MSRLSVGSALDAAAQQCTHRYLIDTARWLSELALSGESSVLESVALPTTYATVHTSLSASTNAAARLSDDRSTRVSAATTARSGQSDEAALKTTHVGDGETLKEDDEAWFRVLHMDDVLTLPITEVRRLLETQYEAPNALSPSRGTQPSARTDEIADVTRAAIQRVERWRRYHRLALVLLQKGEYQRCHHLLAKMVQEEAPSSAPTATDDEEKDPHDHVSGPSERVPFAQTTAPPCLQFLCLYALYLDGQRASVTMAGTASHSPNAAAASAGGGPALRARSARVMNPHLRLLRGMLLDALRNKQTPAPSDAGEAIGKRETTATRSPPARLSVATAAARSRASTDARTAQWLIDGMRLSGRASVPATPHRLNASQCSSRASKRRHADTEVDGRPDARRALPDPYLSWLLGVVLRDLGMKQESATHLLASVQAHPFLWCAWEDLATLVSRDAQLEDIVHALMPQSAEVHARTHTTTNARATSTLPAGADGSQIDVLALMLSIFLAHTRAALGVAPVLAPQLVDTTGLVPLLNASRATDSGAGNNTMGEDTRAGRSTGDTGSPPRGTASPDELAKDEEDELHGTGDAYSFSSSSLKAIRPAATKMMMSPTRVVSAAADLTTWELLLHAFPQNAFLLQHLAGYHYHQCRDLDVAQRLYERLLRLDPYRLEGTTDYSNILFMKHDRLSLSSLAQRCYQLDPFRSESNFVVGNYYVLLGQHERSVLHFRRAVAIHPRFVGAWTLLGHAYLETRNTTAAVEAYSVAVELDPRDYRGWYNLGQVYELLQAYHHALYYYWHTTSLRATDPRMWMAVANCLEHDGRLGEAVVCLSRAEACESPSAPAYPALVRRIAEYYIAESNMSRACVYLQKLVNARAATTEDLVFALPFLVQQRLREVERLIEMPARSPSYDSAVLRHAGSGSGSGSWPPPTQPIGSQHTPPLRASSSAASPAVRAANAGAPPPMTSTATGAGAASSRVERALALLDEVERDLNTIEQLDTGTVRTASTAGDDSLPHATTPLATASSPRTGYRHDERLSALAQFVLSRRRDVQMNRSVIEYSCGGQA